MTDTRRSLSALKTLVQKGGRALTGQDMRDLVASTYPTSATEGFGFGLWFGSPLVVVPAAADTNSYGAVVQMPFGSGASYNTFPDGWVDADYALDNDDPRNSYGITWDGAFMLPTGVYTTDATAFFDVPITPPGIVCPVDCYFDQAEYDPDLDSPYDNTQPFVYDGYFNGTVMMHMYPVVNGDHTQIVAVRSRSVSVNDNADPSPFVVVLGHVDKATDTNVTNVQVIIHKVE